MTVLLMALFLLLAPYNFWCLLSKSGWELYLPQKLSSQLAFNNNNKKNQPPNQPYPNPITLQTAFHYSHSFEEEKVSSDLREGT